VNIAIIDDKEDIKYAIEKILKKQGHTCYGFEGGEEDLIDGLEAFEIDLIILDMMLAKSLSGLDVIDRIRGHSIDTPIIMITAYTTPSNIIKASKVGVIDIIQKPFSTQDIVDTVAKYTPNTQKRSLENEVDSERFIGSYGTMQEIYKNIGIAANSDLNVLIIGETGSGKELVAKLIHKNSQNGGEPFLAINCATIPENLFERLMYGRVENFAKNQNEANIGYAKQVGNGVLFLDEIDELHTTLQAKLLRFLETKSFYPLGSTVEEKFCGKIICASSKSKEELQNNNLFRNDLYFRIATFCIEIPSLKERKEDIKDLANYFVELFCAQTGVKKKEIEIDAINFLKEYEFKGNVRELKNLIHRVVLSSRNETISLDDIKENIDKKTDKRGVLLKKSVGELLSLYTIEETQSLFEDIEREILSLLLQKCNNISKVAQHLNITRNTLKAKMKKYALK